MSGLGFIPLGGGSGTYVPVRPATAVFLGHSFTSHAIDASGNYMDEGWSIWFQALSGQALSLLNLAGVSGERYDQFLTRVPAAVTAYSPGWVFLDAPTNDITNRDTLATIQNRTLALLAALAPARVVTYTCPPNTANDSAQNAVRDQYNDWIRRLPNSRNAAVMATGLLVAEVHDVTATAGAETFSTALTTDGTHPNCDGALNIGTAVYNAVAPYLPAALNGRLSQGADSLNILGSASAFITPTAGLAAGWSNSDGTNLTPSIVASTDGVQSNWQRSTVAAGNSAQLFARPAGWAVGDVFFASVECRVQSLGAASGAFPYFYLRTTCLGAAGTPSAYSPYTLGVNPRKIVPGKTLTLVTPPITVATGTTNLQIGLISFGVQTIDWRRPRLAKVGTAVT